MDVYPFVTDVLDRLRARTAQVAGIGLISNTSTETAAGMRRLLDEAGLAVPRRRPPAVQLGRGLDKSRPAFELAAARAGAAPRGASSWARVRPSAGWRPRPASSPHPTCSTFSTRTSPTTRSRPPCLPTSEATASAPSRCTPSTAGRRPCSTTCATEQGGDVDLGAPAGGEDLSDLDPETAARRHLDQVLASGRCRRSPRRPSPAATRFSSLGATTVPLTRTHGQVPPDGGRHPDLRVAGHGRAGRGQRPGQHRLRPG